MLRILCSCTGPKLLRHTNRSRSWPNLTLTTQLSKIIWASPKGWTWIFILPLPIVVKQQSRQLFWTWSLWTSCSKQQWSFSFSTSWDSRVQSEPKPIEASDFFSTSTSFSTHVGDRGRILFEPRCIVLDVAAGEMQRQSLTVECTWARSIDVCSAWSGSKRVIVLLCNEVITLIRLISLISVIKFGRQPPLHLSCLFLISSSSIFTPSTQHHRHGLRC